MIYIGVRENALVVYLFMVLFPRIIMLPCHRYIPILHYAKHKYSRHFFYQDILMLVRIMLESHKNVWQTRKKILAYDIFYNQISVFLRQAFYNYINITKNIININWT